MIKIDGFLVVRTNDEKSGSVFNEYYKLYDTYAAAEFNIKRTGLIGFCIVPVCWQIDGIYKYYEKVPDCIHI